MHVYEYECLCLSVRVWVGVCLGLCVCLYVCVILQSRVVKVWQPPAEKSELPASKRSFHPPTCPPKRGGMHSLTLSHVVTHTH